MFSDRVPQTALGEPLAVGDNPAPSFDAAENFGLVDQGGKWLSNRPLVDLDVHTAILVTHGIGSGKTHRAIELINTAVLENPRARVLFVLPNHVLTKEFAAKIPNAMVWEGQSRLCPRKDDMASADNARLPLSLLCGTKKNPCYKRKGCPWIDQKARFKDAEDKPLVVLAAGNLAVENGLTRIQRGPDFKTVTELMGKGDVETKIPNDPWLVIYDELVPSVNLVRSGFCSGQAFSAYGELDKTELFVEREALTEKIIELVGGVHRKGAVRSVAKEIAVHTDQIKMIDACRAYLKADADGVIRHVETGFVLNYRLGIHKTRGTTVILDAKADPELVQKWFDTPLEIHRAQFFRVPPDNVNVAQLRDHQFGYTYAHRPRMFAACSAMVWRKSKEYETVGVVCSLEMLDGMGPLPSNVSVLTFGSSAGSNALETVDCGIVISRAVPDFNAVRDAAEATYGKPFPNDGYVFGPNEYLVRHHESGNILPMTREHAHRLHCGDPKLEAVRTVMVDAPFDQAVGRFRAHNRTRDTPLDLVVLTSHPMSDLPVDNWFTLYDWRVHSLADLGIWCTDPARALLYTVFGGFVGGGTLKTATDFVRRQGLPRLAETPRPKDAKQYTISIPGFGRKVVFWSDRPLEYFEAVLKARLPSF